MLTGASSPEVENGGGIVGRWIDQKDLDQTTGLRQKVFQSLTKRDFTV